MHLAAAPGAAALRRETRPRMIQRLPRSAIPAAVLVFGALAGVAPARALGFGAAPSSIPFGQPLDLSVPLRLGDAPPPPPACLQAQVSIGEHRLPPGSVQVQLEDRDPPRVRIRSEVAVQEPTVTLRLTAGCQGPVSRQFVVLADPARAAPPAVAAAAVAAPRRSVAAEARRAPAPSERSLLGDAPARAPVLPLTRATAAAAATPPPMRVQTAPPAELPAAERAAAAAAWAAVATAERQLAQMKGELAQARDDAAAQGASLAQMRTRLTQAEHQRRVQAALAAFVLALGLVALWLGGRVRALQRARRGTPHDAEAIDAGDAPAAVSAAVAPVAPSAPFAPPPPLAVPPEQRAPSAAQPVDALIDLEQQVEFFVLLGDDGAAVELLQAHLRTHAAAGPLPYLRLLQMHRRREERDEHTRVGRRFAQRFATPAPVWDAADEVHALQDDAAIVAGLQARWADPAEAMDWLERLLADADGGALLRLDACCDALTLYTVARELQRRPCEAAADVDLLLPLAVDDAVAAALRPSIFDTLQPRHSEPSALDVDLDAPAALTGSCGAERPRGNA